jgi:hypothetical protein
MQLTGRPMARFLRDIRISNVTVSEELLKAVHDLLIGRWRATNAAIEAKNATDQEKSDERLLLSYVVRFDNRGYRLHDPDEALRCYKQAAEVERVIFTLDSALSERSNRLYGMFFELRLDAKDPNNCFIQASADDSDIVDSVYNGLLEIVTKNKNTNGWIRNTWSQLLVQVFGVAAGFILSLIAGLKIAPYLKIDNAFVLTFLFAFLIFSNTWGFVNQQILRLVNYSFPNIRFVRTGKDSTHWLIQTLVGGVLVALFLLIFSELMAWVGSVLGEHVAA